MERVTGRVLQAIASATLLCFLTAGPATCDAVSPDMGPLDVGLLLLKLGPHDLRVKPEFTHDRVAGGRLRLNHVTDGLRSATGSTRSALELGNALTGEPHASRRFESLAALLDQGQVSVSLPTTPLHPTAPLAAALADPLSRDAPAAAAEAPEPIDSLPLEVRQALAELVYGTALANTLYARAVRGLSPEDETAIRGVLPALLGQQPQLIEADVLAALRTASQLGTRELLLATASLLGSVEAARAALSRLPAPEGETAPEGPAFTRETDFGTIVVAGAGDDLHERPTAILVDLGGNDRYSIDGPVGAAPPVRVIIDLAGDDTHTSRMAAGSGAALLGISVLVDEAGADTYETDETLSFGSAICGAGVLVDAAGDDRYDGDVLTQGAAMFGLGMLVDVEGDDEYSAALCGQGFGCVAGVGALVDSAGTDRYDAGRKYSTTVGGQGEMLALSQGFGLGLRPWAPGGIGILADAAGNDIYRADARAQGSGWWYGSGALLDTGGDDEYHGGPFSQGTGNFLATGHLLDAEGGDRYEAPAFCQGFARDRGIGILRDAKGDDSYAATRMAQGAATGNAIALAIDLLGADTYVAPEDSQGYVPPGEHSTTIGLFADGGGEDSYAGRSRDNICWFTGRLGVGIDVTGGNLQEVTARVRSVIGPGVPGAFNIGPVPIAARVPTVGDEAQIAALYEAATTTDSPVDRRNAIVALTRIGEDAADFIAPKLTARRRADVDNARSVLADLGSPAVPALLKVMEEAETDAATAAMQALADIGDPRAAKHLVEQADSPHWRIRAAAAGGMGALVGEDTRLALEQLLNDADEDVRRSAVTALRRRGSTESALAISDKLGDRSYAVRFAAADALVSLGVRCPDHVFSLVGAGDPAIRHLSLETCGRMSSAESVPMLEKLLQSGAWADRAFAAEAICYVGAPQSCEPLKAALAAETNGLVLAKADAALRATKFCEVNP